MNIGIDIRCLMDKQRTGVGEYTYNLLNALFECNNTDGEIDNADKNQYFLFYNSSSDVSKLIPKWGGNNIHYVGTKWPNKLLNLLVWLKFIKLDNLVIKNCFKIYNLKFKIDTWFSPNLNFTNLSRGVKHIQTIHDLSFEILPECFTWKRRLWHWFLNPKKQCQKADLIVVPSENTRRDIINKFQISNFKFQILRPGLSEKFKANSSQPIDVVKEKYNLPEKFILFLGTLEPRKNIKTIIEAFINSKLLASGYELILAGSLGWKNKKLLKLIQSTPGVKYIGYVDDKDKPALYKLCELFIFPSLYEGFGLPVLEAMACGTPVITSNRSSLPEVGGEAVCLVNPYNVEEIAEAMNNILKNKELIELMVVKLKTKAESFNWEKTAYEFLNCF